MQRLSVGVGGSFLAVVAGLVLRLIIAAAALVSAFTPGVLDARFGGLVLAAVRSLVVLLAVSLFLRWRALPQAVLRLKKGQAFALAWLGTLIALAAALYWWFGTWWCSYRCGPNQTLFLLIGIGSLAAAVTALWVAAKRSHTGVLPVILFGAVAAISFYMMFGPPPS